MTKLDDFRDIHIDDIVKLQHHFHVGLIHHSSAELLEIFPNYDYHHPKTEYLHLLKFSHSENYVGLQQQCFCYFWASRTIWINGLLGVEIGSGGKKTPYCLSTDIYNGEHVEMITNGIKLPFVDKSIELILSNHVLEHINQPIDITLSHWIEKLRPHGIIAFICPDNKYDSVLDMDITHVHSTDSRTFKNKYLMIKEIEIIEYNTLNNGFSFNVVCRKR